MNEILEATIEVVTVGKGKKQAKVTLPTNKGSTAFPLSPATLSRDLVEQFNKNPDGLQGMKVQVDRDSGQVKRAWPSGEQWEAAPPPPPKNGPHHKGSLPGKRWNQHGKPGAGKNPVPQGPNQSSGDTHMGDFENPYNFVPAPPRADAVSTDLGDHAPIGHHRYHEDHWTGRITVKLTTKTPLLIPDAADLHREDNHNTYGVRKDADDAPYLPPTSVKGMLRSAYEAVTNSRMGVLDEHENALAYRLDAREGISMVPARISQTPSAGRQINMLLGESEIDLAQTGPGFGQPENELMYAAWVGAYRHRDTDYEISYPRRRHGAHVWAYVTKWRHTGRARFQFWNVEALRDFSDHEPTDAPSFLAAEWRNGRRERAHEGHWVQGWLCISGRNIGSKHHERLFFIDSKRRPMAAYKISPEQRDWIHIEKHWKTLIRNYQAAHAEKDIWQRRDERRHRTARPEDYLGHKPGQTAWSSHVFQDGKPRRDNHSEQPDAAELGDGTLCYLRLVREQNAYRISGLYPVMISRELYALEPINLLDDRLRPAAEIGDLSPADRVFGWVRDDSRPDNRNKSRQGTFRGQLKIGPVTCSEGKDAIVSLGDDEDGKPGRPLAILGQPKPQQARFYSAKNALGEPLAPRTDKNKTYADSNQGLRGRKFYPHQKAATEIAEFWELEKPLEQGMTFNKKTTYQEFRRLPDPEHNNRTRDEQNRSITEWVKPKSTFTFEIQVTNLSKVELGALLWLLKLPEEHYFHLGLGKPLGFGSVQMEIDGLDLRDGVAIADDYRSLIGRATAGGRIEKADQKPLTDAIGEFKQAAQQAAGNKPFEEVDYINAFLNACTGGDLPVHYPRTGAARTSSKVYEWFVKNEGGGNGPQDALPSLTNSRRGLRYP